jgi:UDP-N-acetylglucosamine 2-epimerase
MNKENLAKENVVKNVFVTGNAVIDAFKTTVKDGYKFCSEILHGIDYSVKRIILVTAHRHENLGQTLSVNPYGDGHACERIVNILDSLGGAVWETI